MIMVASTGRTASRLSSIRAADGGAGSSVSMRGSWDQFARFERTITRRTVCALMIAVIMASPWRRAVHAADEELLTARGFGGSSPRGRGKQSFKRCRRERRSRYPAPSSRLHAWDPQTPTLADEAMIRLTIFDTT
jgi:hypothetical protein